MRFVTDRLCIRNRGSNRTFAITDWGCKHPLEQIVTMMGGGGWWWRLLIEIQRKEDLDSKAS